MTDSQAYHHGTLRRALLNDAAALLNEGGQDELSLRALARRAGVSPRAPYRHFADKEALLTALAAQAFVAFGHALAAADAAAEPGRELEAQAIAYVRFALAAPARFQLMFGPRRYQADDELVAAKRAAFGVLQARVDLNAEPGEDGRARAVGCWSLAHGLAVLFLDGRIRDELDGDDDDIMRRVVRATLRGGSPDAAAG
ncbi:TetR/AcrR family transcriptional regulator [Sphingomonas bacterium]|uniref:TetR/AcrR family transcriptional regulator n=1 Tax=Sphingomonas bacterium TaxID=1895847 RepID=UPI001576B655|nr:TetR/AcrR family transcriptional regulator [Sphingomonas bacterium]